MYAFFANAKSSSLTYRSEREDGAIGHRCAGVAVVNASRAPLRADGEINGARELD